MSKTASCSNSTTGLSGLSEKVDLQEIVLGRRLLRPRFVGKEKRGPIRLELPKVKVNKQSQRIVRGRCFHLLRAASHGARRPGEEEALLPPLNACPAISFSSFAETDLTG